LAGCEADVVARRPAFVRLLLVFCCLVVVWLMQAAQPTGTEFVRIIFKNIFSSQLRVNIFSGVAATMVNIIVMAIAYPIYLHFLGYEQYGVWLVLSVVLTFAQLGNLG
jgi:K+ transporter